MTGTAIACESEVALNRIAKDARIVQLKPGRPGPSFFLIPGLGGSIEGLAELGALLDTPMPVYVIEGRGVDGFSPPDDQVEEIARHYLTRIQTVQAVGPYFLAGHSFGGLVVFEIAQRLLEANERIARLILFDSPISQRYWPLRFYLKDLRARSRRHLARLLAISAKENLRYYSHRLRSRGYRLHRMPIGGTSDNNARVMLANEIALKRYHPKFYSGKLTFFRSTHRDTVDCEILWRNWVQELEVHLAAGGHNSMLHPPNVSSLARDTSLLLITATPTSAKVVALADETPRDHPR
jgi:acetoacetyl-CoA synthetase